MEESRLKLVRPTLEMKEQALDYRAEHFENGEMYLNGGALLGSMEYEAWLTQTLDNADGNSVHSSWVQSSTFFVVRKADERIVGMVDVRHYLNKALSNCGGHIGYGVRPSERQKGYAGELLELALDYARKLELESVMLTCDKDNEASRRTILGGGGVLNKEYVNENGQTVQIYWIQL